MRRRSLFCITIILLVWAHSHAQVTNNSIKDRITLDLDADWFASFTTNSTVEWECVNKALTSACVVYHNDQWFTFSVEKDSTYYINIKNQRCRNMQGVQIIVIEGDPCKIDTYKLIECIAYTDQSDIYVPLRNIKAGIDYLVNIDGYLGDLCDFSIQVSSTLKGIPARKRNLNLLNLEAAAEDSIVTVLWKLPDSLMYRLNGFTLYRKHQLQKGVTEIASVPLQRNTLGVAMEAYRIIDTLHQQGVYEYQIYGASHDEGMILLSSTSVTYRHYVANKRAPSYNVNFSYRGKGSELISVDVYDDSSDRYLFSTTRRASKGNNRYGLDLTRYVDVGIVFFKVVVTGKAGRSEERFTMKRLEK